MATCSNILAWKIPWTEEPDRLQSTGSQRVRHNWGTNTCFLAVILYAYFGVSLSCWRLSLKSGDHWSICKNEIMNHPCDWAFVFVLDSLMEGLHCWWSGGKPLFYLVKIFKKWKKVLKVSFPLTVITEYWLCAPCCTLHPWAYLTAVGFCLLCPHPYVALLPPPMVTTSLFSFSVSLLLYGFIHQFFYFIVLDST